MSIKIKKEYHSKGWHSNGQLRCEIPYINGNRHGLGKWWHKNGFFYCKESYINGFCHGLSEMYYDNGMADLKISYKNNLQCGAMIYFKY